ALVLALTDQEQQVAVGGLHVEDGDLGLGPRLADDLEKLALAVGLHVQGDHARRAAAARRVAGDFQPCADSGKLGVEEVRVHEGVDTLAGGQVHRGVRNCRPPLFSAVLGKLTSAATNADVATGRACRRGAARSLSADRRSGTTTTADSSSPARRWPAVPA